MRQIISYSLPHLKSWVTGRVLDSSQSATITICLWFHHHPLHRGRKKKKKKKERMKKRTMARRLLRKILTRRPLDTPIYGLYSPFVSEEMVDGN